MKNTDSANCNNFKIRNRLIFLFCLMSVSLRIYLNHVAGSNNRENFTDANSRQDTSRYKVDTFLKWTHFRGPNGVRFIEDSLYTSVHIRFDTIYLLNIGF